MEFWVTQAFNGIHTGRSCSFLPEGFPSMEDAGEEVVGEIAVQCDVQVI